jgi:hypothetical protein
MRNLRTGGHAPPIGGSMETTTTAGPDLCRQGACRLSGTNVTSVADKEKNWFGGLMVAGFIVFLLWGSSCIADSRGITCYGDDCPDALFVD